MFQHLVNMTHLALEVGVYPEEGEIIYDFLKEIKTKVEHGTY